jgi:hypothetical protein
MFGLLFLGVPIVNFLSHREETGLQWTIIFLLSNLQTADSRLCLPLPINRLGLRLVKRLDKEDENADQEDVYVRLLSAMESRESGCIGGCKI